MSQSDLNIPGSFRGVWFAEDGEIFLSFEAGGEDNRHTESHPLKSPASQGWARRHLRHTNGKPPTAYDVENFTNDLMSKAYEDNIRMETFLRVGEFEDRIYVDLGTPDWKCVEIDAEGWRIILQAPIAFRRNAQMRPLPIPESGGSFEVLREFANFPSRTDFLLFVSFLINAYHPTGPYFHLFLIGEKGSAKSSLALLIQKLIHPSASSLKGFPKDENNLIIEAYHNRLVMIDNANDLGKWMPDALCRLATGSGTSARSLYTNRDQMAFSVARPALMTAHEIPSKQDDLIERSLVVQLERLDSFGTRSVIRKFDRISGKILGVIFDALSQSLANQKVMPEESLRLHRMADASYLIACGFEKIGWDSPEDFLMAIEAVQSEATTKTDAGKDPLISAVVQAMASRDEWQDTPTEILNVLRAEAKNPHILPKTANVLSRRLKNLDGYFFAYGLVVTTGLHAPGGTDRLIRIAKNPAVYRLPSDTVMEKAQGNQSA